MVGLGLGLGFTKGGSKVIPYNEIDGHIFRLDATDSNNYTLSGSNLNTWTDDVGSVTFVDLAAMPLLEDDISAGIDSFDFDTGNGGIRGSSANFKDLTGMTVFLAFKCKVDIFTTFETIYGHLLSIGSRASNSLEIGSPSAAYAGDGLTISHWASGSEVKSLGISARALRAEVDDTLILAIRVGSGGSQVFRGEKPINFGHYNYTMYNGADEDTDFSPDALGVSTNWIGFGTAITSDAGGVSRDGEVNYCEMNIYNRELSDNEIKSVVRQLEDKLGIDSVVPRDVIMVAGQSNALGQEGTKTAYNSALAGSEIMENGHTRRDLITSTADADTTSDVGVETPASRKHKSTNGKDNIVLKAAFGGTSLAVHWKPTVTYGANLQTALAEWDRALLSSLQGNGYDPNVVGFFWIQGEQDATDNTNSAAYETNLTTFINLIRSRYGSFPFIIAKLNPDLSISSFPGRDIVRSAQDAVAAAMSDVYTVETTNLTTSDGVHYDIDSIVSLGEAMLDAAVDRENKTAPAP